jgi:Methyltransferase domain
MVRHFRPRRIVEIGSGFSTMVSAQAALRNGSTQLIAVEPHPSELLRKGFPGLTTLIPRKVEEVDPALFAGLGSGDILFIDSSHVVRTGGDVNFLYLELLPRLADGVVVHVHDVFLPRDYPRDWVVDKRIFWTEQYLLHAFLIFNSAFGVLYSTPFMAERHPDRVRAAFPECPWVGGGSFWMRRRVGADLL